MQLTLAIVHSSKRLSILRIVSLAPSCTSILCALGAKRHLVAVTPWCADVCAVRGLPVVGDCWRNASIEKIVRLRPTLIIGSVPFHSETVGRILAIPAQFLALNSRSLTDIESDIRTLARITNRSAQGSRLIAGMRSEFAHIASLSGKFSRHPRIYSEAWPNPRISSPPWVGELIALCGGKMVVKPGARVSDQEIASARPDIILLAWAATGNRANPQRTFANAAWKNVPAIRHKRVFVVRDELLNTPGPTLIAGAREISRILNGFAGDTA
jgi:iron complex transport system substrate-binding protein